MMEGWGLLCSLHIKVNVIGMLGRTVLQVGRDQKAEEYGVCRTGSQGQWGSRLAVGGET